jgi:heme-degrading monooxygenase HmoA
MIVEHAEFTVADPVAFERAFEQAREVIAQASGFHFAELLQGVERPGTYLLLVGWDSVDDHMVGFRESPLYEQWRRLIHPQLTAPAGVEHYAVRAGDRKERR